MLSIENIQQMWFEKDLEPVEIPVVLSDKNIIENRNKIQIFDHNQIDNKFLVANFYSATNQDIDDAIKNAKSDFAWAKLSDEERIKIIKKLPEELDKNYNRIVGGIMVNTGKLPQLVESEISKVKEFIAFYTESYLKLKEQNEDQVIIKAKGVGLVISPWNYPVALPGGSIIASLIAGNNVLFKPSNLSVLGSYLFAECFWNVGVPKSALQFLAIEDRLTSEYLTSKKEIDYVFFVGSTQVALNIIHNRPDVYMAAETGGKNVMMITKTANKEQVIKDIIKSCFMNAGQVCSSTSLITAVPEIYNDKDFLQKLADEVNNLYVAHASDQKSKMPALIRRPIGDTLWGLTELEEGESWLVKPKQLDDSATLWSPGIRIGTKFRGKAHLTEFFAPTIAIMQVANVEEGVKVTNETGYGLTSAIQTTDKNEQDIWLNGVKAGTISVNKDTTVCSKVKAQPFGGMGKSAFGSGIKVGGYNYITQFLKYENKNIKNYDSEEVEIKMIDSMSISKCDKNEIDKFMLYAKNYKHWYKTYFNIETDHKIIPDMINILKFVKTETMAVRLVANNSISDMLCMMYAAFYCSKKLIISADISVKEKLNDSNIIYEDVDSFIKKINTFNRIRYADKNSVEKGVFEEAGKTGIYVANAPILGFGRLELLHYLQEQTIVIT